MLHLATCYDINYISQMTLARDRMVTIQQLSERVENEREWRRELNKKIDKIDTKLTWLIGIYTTSMIAIILGVLAIAFRLFTS